MLVVPFEFDAPVSAAFPRPGSVGQVTDRPALARHELKGIATRLARSGPGDDPAWTEGERRRYCRLIATDRYDAWLIAWSPCSGVELHDHGGSQGAVAVASGRLLEHYTDLRWRPPIRSRIVDPGVTVSVPGIRVHEVSNPGPTDALSVHVYSPPLTTMTFFDPRPDALLVPLQTTRGELATLEETTTLL